MSKKDYIVVASAIKSASNYITVPAPQLEILCQVINQLADGFYCDNPRFDYPKFLNACGLNEVTK